MAISPVTRQTQWGPGQTRRSPTSNELIIEDKGKTDGLESPEERSARWGAELLAALRLTNKRGLLIHARSVEIRAALYGALEVLAERDAAQYMAMVEHQTALAKHFHGEARSREGEAIDARAC